MKRCCALLVVVVALLGAGAALADRGSIPFDPLVRVFEPNQRAIIGWNGQEEVLILTTDLQASAPTQVLEVLPLPAEPTVTESDVQVFSDLTAIINSHLAAAEDDGSRNQGMAAGAPGPAAEVTFHERIGAHDVTVFKVLDQGGFVSWVEDYLAAQNAQAVTVPDPLEQVVGEYLADGYAWFVFDVVSLDSEPKTNQAIQYRFASDSLYYPLRITRTEEGPTTVDLIVLTPDPLTDFPGLDKNRVELMHQLITVSNEEIAGVSDDLHGLFAAGEYLTLRIWQIQGDISSFTADLLAR